MFTSLYLAFFQENVISFLLFLAVVPSAINVLFAYFINFVPFEQSGETPASTGAPCYPFFFACLLPHDSQQRQLHGSHMFEVLGMLSPRAKTDS